MPWLSLIVVAIAIVAAPLTLRGQSSPALSPPQRLARDIFRELIGINTTHESGSTTTAAHAMAARLRAAGFPAADVSVVGPAGSKNHNVVARLRGSGSRRPVLLLAHLDVVEARREDWSFDPFVLLERDGFFYGRGTSDIKDGAAILVATLARLRQEGYRPDRDLVVALTAGEESGGDYNGVQWLLETHRNLVDGAYCVNMDAGDPQAQRGKRIFRTVQVSEKVPVDFRLEVKSNGGHSSRPTKENAIYRLSAGLVRLAGHDFPARLNDVTRTYFDRMSRVQTGQLAADMKAVTRTPPDSAAVARLSESPYYNALLRTTCVPTLLAGGHAINALPQLARADVNCRLLPGDSADEVERTLKGTLADEKVLVSRLDSPRPSLASPLVPDVVGPIERTTARLWPGIPVVPAMDTGATDGAYLRAAGIPTYGVSGVFLDVDDRRAHGKDERIGVKDYDDGAEYIYQLVKEVSTGR